MYWKHENAAPALPEGCRLPAEGGPATDQVMAQPGSGCKATTRCLEGTAPPAMAQSDAEALAGALDKDEGRASPCTPSTPSVCSPPSAASSVPSAGKNICSSCGLEILDRYLLKGTASRWRGQCPRNRTVSPSRPSARGHPSPLSSCRLCRRSSRRTTTPTHRRCRSLRT
uniref:Uncharacterized protein n=1 Tax=Felis catus TaxID=9685 RepID=A0ABI7XQE2_FELCA